MSQKSRQFQKGPKMVLKRLLLSKMHLYKSWGAHATGVLPVPRSLAHVGRYVAILYNV